MIDRARLWRAGLLGAALLSAIVLAQCESKPTTPPPPNVVFILSDALRAASLPMYGYPRNNAPRLSELAKESVLFESHFAHYPGTSVSLSQIHTGRLMAPLLVTYKYMAVPVRGLPADLLLLPRELGAAGYYTGIVTSHYWLTGEQSWLMRFFEEKRFVPPGVPGHPYAFYEELWPAITEFFDHARKSGKPFFLYLHSLDTHGPNAFHEGYEQFHDDSWPDAYNRYDSEIRYTDHWVGKVIDELRQRKLLDNTIVVFTGDHGDDFNEVGPETWNNNHGPFPRRSLLHVPLLIRLPGGRFGGTRYQGLTRHVDLAPTLMRLALPGFDLARVRVDGEDLSPELLSGSNGADKDRTSYSFTPHFWGLTQRDVEITYDLWSGEFSPLLRPRRDARNYPLLEPVDDATRRDRLIQDLAHERDSKVQEFVDLPPTTELPNPALVGFLLPIMGIENPSPKTGPVLESNPDDNRWTIDPNVVAAAATEHPQPLTMWTPWVPGTYEVSVLLHSQGLRDKLKDDVRIEVGHGDNPPVHIDSTQADAQGWVKIGSQKTGDKLFITLSDPQGGVKLTALKLERPQASTPATPATPDEAVRERLRVLGYKD